jgi:hypothetical protein
MESKMLKKLIFLLVTFSAVIGNAVAKTACTPNKIAASVDRFRSEPYGIRAWRVLHGLGDPVIDPSSVEYTYWHDAEDWKALVVSVAPDLTVAQETDYECRLHYPLQVLKDRVAGLGKGSAYVKQWLLSQSVVLAACGGKNPTSFDLPPPLPDQPPNVTTLQNDDRAYQAASVAFYRDKPKSVELFRKIATSNSVHKAYARYNVANLLANSKDLVGARAEAKAILADPAMSSAHAIAQELLGYISNIEDTPEGWASLIDSTLSVLGKSEAEIMASPKLKSDYARAIYDIGFAGIGAKQSEWWVKGELPENATLSKAIADAARKSPAALWLMTGQSVNANYDRASWAMIGDKWNGWAASYIDRAKALTPAGSQINGAALEVLDVLKAKPDDATRAAIWAKAKAAIDATQKSCGAGNESAAVGQLLLHAVRLSAQANKYDEIYAGLSSVPFKSSEFYTDGVVYKLAQYVLATGNAEEGRRLRERLLTADFFSAVPAEKRDTLKVEFSDFHSWVAEDEKLWVDAVTMSNTKLGSPFFNLLSSDQLRSLAEDKRFSSDQQSLLLRTAWTRQYARGQKIPSATTEAMLAANLGIKSTLETVVKEQPKLNADRRWLLTILRNPRFGILVNSTDSFGDSIETTRADFAALDEFDHNDKNWWCPLEPGRQLHALRASFDAASGTDIALDYRRQEIEPAYDQAMADKISAAREMLLKQHPMVKAINSVELASLAKMSSAPATLTTAAIAWGKSSKGNDGAPEALALAVRATRYGCSWHGGHKAYSKPAQELLKSKFGKSDWATKTPYWFDCMASIYDKDFNKVTSCQPQAWPKDELPR